MVSYKELGLVNTREMFKKAVDGGYAIPAFNFNNMEQLQAIVKASAETKSPVILQVSKGARQYANATMLLYMAEGAVAYAKELGWANPQIVLHLDHGDSFELCKSCIEMGFSSVMIDGSHLPYEENIALTRKVVDYAHQYDVTVEGELGVLAGVEDEVSAEHHTYTRPEEVIDFATRTGCDSLAISIGTSHGANKFRPEQCTRDANGVLIPPPLRFDILEQIEKKLPGFPIVLHGSSSVPQDQVAIINKYGGALKDAIGIPEEQLRRAAKSAVCKINIDSDSRLAMTASVREVLALKPAEFDPRKYLGPARDNMERLYKHKIENVLGSNGKAV
ncbi:fructose-1,6-bisphosphate aldolase, class II [Bacteroidetes oral taxon 274 str. F0058]|nr:fructose-1,6-bisphosphate aldolase, class II [Bacteroidetes oral taxon 274 str. F0058]